MQSCTADLAIAAMIMPKGVHSSLLVGLVSPARCVQEPDLMTENDSAKEVDEHTRYKCMHTQSSDGNRLLQLE